MVSRLNFTASLIKRKYSMTFISRPDVKELIEKLTMWKPNMGDDIGEEQEKFLHAEGEKEMILMAERYAERFPTLLKGHYHPELFKFRSTYTQR